MSNSTLAAKSVWPEGVERIDLARVDSTMSEASRRAGSLISPTWISADEQTSARGRRGKVWRSLTGNLSATLVMRPGGTAAEAALRSFVAALALHDALRDLSGPAVSYALKWPNDVLLNGGKLAGILLERLGDGTLLVGVGVNLGTAPLPEDIEAGAVRPVSLAGETGQSLSPGVLLTHLAAAFSRREEMLRVQGFAPLRDAWLARAARIGQPIRARVGDMEHRGTFETIDALGHLVLAMESGRISIPAADVSFEPCP